MPLHDRTVTIPGGRPRNPDNAHYQAISTRRAGGGVSDITEMSLSTHILQVSRRSHTIHSCSGIPVARIPSQRLFSPERGRAWEKPGRPRGKDSGYPGIPDDGRSLDAGAFCKTNTASISRRFAGRQARSMWASGANGLSCRFPRGMIVDPVAEGETLQGTPARRPDRRAARAEAAGGVSRRRRAHPPSRTRLRGCRGRISPPHGLLSR